MLRRVRWLIIGSVLMFVSASLIMSCTGGVSGCGGYFDAFGDFIPGACPTPGPVTGFELQSINVCYGPPASPTPTPTGTISPTPTPTACPQATSTSVESGAIIQFHADGTFAKKTQTTVLDITNLKQTLWTSQGQPSGAPTPLLPPTQGNGGTYTGLQVGCACINASAGGIISLPVGVTVFSTSQPTPSCPPCPTPSPTTTATPTARRANAALSTASTDTAPAGVMQWTFDAAMPLSGPVAGAPDGSAYFVTSDSVLHAISATGAEKWHTLASDGSVAVSPDGSLVYLRGTDGKLKALSADGKYQWGANVALSQGPLAASANSVFAVTSDGQLVAITSPGMVLWQVPMGGGVSNAAVLPGGGVIVALSHGDVTAVSGEGVPRWSFTPDGGFAGTLAVQNGTVYVGSGSGTVYALDTSSGNGLWQYKSGAPVLAGPAVDAQGTVFFASDSLYALGSNGAVRWSNPLLTSGPVVLAGTSSGVFVAASDGPSTAYSDSDAEQWSTRDFANVTSAAFSPPGMLYVANSQGGVYAIK